MRLLIVRHGDPDYSIDSLTERGWREAELLSHRLCKTDITYFYTSPLGRAKDTASCTLKKLGREAEVLPWLREFWPQVHRPDCKAGERRCAWDWLPQDWLKDPVLLDKDHWFTQQNLAECNTEAAYREVIDSFDALLAKHGYVRDGMAYRVERGNHDTLCLFCHFGVESLLLSHLMNVSPLPLWQGLCAAPSSVSTIVTEERRKGIASFRMSAFGDISHLYAAGEEPSFAARFCECFEDDTRHD